MRYLIPVCEQLLIGMALLLPAGTSSGDEPARPEEKPVGLVIQVPADAEVEVQGIKTKQTGEVRTFESPPLGPGVYTYKLKGTWKEDGKATTREVKVDVKPGETKEVDLRTAPEAAPAGKPSPVEPIKQVKHETKAPAGPELKPEPQSVPTKPEPNPNPSR